MGQFKYILLLTLVVLSFLTAVLSASLSSELYLRSANAADMNEDTAEDEHTPAPSGPCHRLKGVTKQSVDLSSLPLMTRRLISHPRGHAFGRFCHSSAAIVYHDAPLYQALQVFRF
jgi:hypothetical protein